MKNLYLLLVLSAFLLAGCNQPTDKVGSDELSKKEQFIRLRAWQKATALPPPVDADGRIDGDLTDDGIKDWGGGMNVDYDINEDDIQDWGDGRFQDDADGPIDADGVTDGDFTDDGIQDWGNGINIDYDIDNNGSQDWGDGRFQDDPLDADGVVDGDLTDDGIQDWGDGMNIDYDIDNDGSQDWGDGRFQDDPLDADGVVDGDLTDDGIQDWGDGMNLDGDVNNDGSQGWGFDTDGDGILDLADPDMDGDGIINSEDQDINGDGINDRDYDPWYNHKLGDRFTVAIIEGADGSITYDYAAMLGNAYYMAVHLDANYYVDNEAGRHYLNRLEIDPLSQSASNWFYVYNADETQAYNIYGANMPYTKKVPAGTPYVYDPNIGRTSIKVYYVQGGINARTGRESTYWLKGLNNGTGEVELVGIHRYDKNAGINQSIGDTNIDAPYVPINKPM